MSDTAIRRLIISDLHFGSGDDLLAARAALERFEPELAWADELVINGDLFELVFASLQDAVNAARPFLTMVNRHVGRVHYVLGNHDHHLVSLAGDERRFCDVLAVPAPPAFRVAPADRLLRSLCPDVDVVSSYPLCELDGVRFMHGHYIAPHIRSDWRLVDRLAWSLTGEITRPDRLAVADYESLIAPLYELMYEIANLPSGRRAQQRFERWLGGAAAIARVPQRATRPLAKAMHRLTDRAGLRQLLTEHDAPTSQVLEAIQAVCCNLEIPLGQVAVGHTHTPLDGLATPSGQHTVFNSGSWVWDRRIRDAPAYREHTWPGTVLRADGAQLELRHLLADCDERDLERMLGVPPSVSHVGRRRASLTVPGHEPLGQAPLR
jgi:calcineurin-like phosphoesterase family protein